MNTDCLKNTQRKLLNTQSVLTVYKVSVQQYFVFCLCFSKKRKTLEMDMISCSDITF